MNIQEQLNKHETNVAKLRALLVKHPKLLTLDGCCFYLDESTAHITCVPRTHAEVGVILGKQGWVKKSNYGRQINWEQEFDGVRVICQNAETLPNPEDCPVDPKQFPLLLTDLEADDQI